jgi:hypothetical protein
MNLSHGIRWCSVVVDGFVVEPHVGVPKLAVDEAHPWFRV